MRTGRPLGRPPLNPDDPLWPRPTNIATTARVHKMVLAASQAAGVSRSTVFRWLIDTDIETRLPRGIEELRKRRRDNGYGDDDDNGTLEPAEPPHITWNVYVCARGSQRVADRLLGTIQGRSDARGLISTAFDRWHSQRDLGSQQFFFEEAAPTPGATPRTKLES